MLLFLVYPKLGDVFVTKLVVGIPCSAAPHLEAAMLLKSLLRAKTLLSMFPWAQPCIAPGFQGIPQFEPQLGAIQLFLIAPLGYRYSNMQLFKFKVCMQKE